MMKLSIFLSLLLVFLLNSCKECEEDVKLQFTAKDDEWLIYKLNQKLTFVNQKGMLQNYVVTEVNTFHRYDDKTLPPFLSNECAKKWFRPTQELTLTEQNLNIKMNIRFSKIKQNDKDLISIYFKSDCGVLSIDEELYNFYKKQFNNKDTVFIRPTSYPTPEITQIVLRKLNNLQTGKSYDYVLRRTSKMYKLAGQSTYYCPYNSNLFYSKEKGLVRFEFYNDSMNEVWELQE